MDNWIVKSTARLVRHRRSRAYFENGRWTENPARATNFPNLQEVVAACVKYQLADVELVMRFESKIPELSFPIK
ncbi:MAG TPA: hypothetical protein VJA21_19460 [Verrucomicrobiae bacterium]